MTLVEFLLTRIAEDEAGSQAATGAFSKEWPYTPERVLDECDAKRRIVKRAANMAVPYAPADPDFWNPYQYAEEEGIEEMGRWLLQTLALPYADHPDYREEWRP